MILETERLILRPFKDTDAKNLYEYAKDERVGPIAGWSPHKSVEESQEIIRTIFSQDGVFAITLKENDKIIGLIALILGEKSNLPITVSEGEVSFWLGVPFWGKGIIPEATKEIIRYGFEDLQLFNIWATYYNGNDKSKRAQEKSGFRYHHTDYNKKNEFINEIQTEHICCITKAEWLKTSR